MSAIVGSTSNQSRTYNRGAIALGCAGVLVGVAVPLIKLAGAPMPKWKVVLPSAAAFSATTLLAAGLWTHLSSVGEKKLPPLPPRGWKEIQVGLQKCAPQFVRSDLPTSEKEWDAYIRQIRKGDRKLLRKTARDLTPTNAQAAAKLTDEYYNAVEQLFSIDEAIVDLLLLKHTHLGRSNEEIGRHIAAQGNVDYGAYFDLTHTYHVWVRNFAYRNEEGRFVSNPEIYQGEAAEIFYQEGSKWNGLRERYNQWCQRWVEIVPHMILKDGRYDGRYERWTTPDLKRSAFKHSHGTMPT